jgi:hypothetical protein
VLTGACNSACCMACPASALLLLLALLLQRCGWHPWPPPSHIDYQQHECIRAVTKIKCGDCKESGERVGPAKVVHVTLQRGR